MSRQKTAEQAKVAEILAAEREAAAAQAEVEAAAVEAKRYKPRDIVKDFEVQPDPEASEQHFAWKYSGGGNPPPPVRGTGGPEPVALAERTRPALFLDNARIDAMVFGGGFREATLNERVVRGRSNKVHVPLQEGIEHPERKTVVWFDTPMYDPMNFATAPWGARYSDYEAARNEAVKRWNARSEDYRSGGMRVTVDGLSHPSYKCAGCQSEVDVVVWHQEFVKFLCRDCAPEIHMPQPLAGSAS